MKENANNINHSIDWEDVENKIGIICYKFSSSIDARFLEDMAQELRIHAYYKSDDYYDLQRKAIDYWRTLSRKVFPETPYIDLELMENVKDFSVINDLHFQEIVNSIKKELHKDVYTSKSDIKINTIALDILDILLVDIVDGMIVDNDDDTIEHLGIYKYRNGKINMSYLDKVFEDIHYGMIQKAVYRLREVIEGLQEMGII